MALVEYVKLKEEESRQITSEKELQDFNRELLERFSQVLTDEYPLFNVASNDVARINK
jgi:hypothetical protein